MRLESGYVGVSKAIAGQARGARKSSLLDHLRVAAQLSIFAAVSGVAQTQVNVVTGHNDIARTGQNLNETVLTPANVSGGGFGKLFTQTVNGVVLPQPLYVSQVTIPGKGVHNVLYAATSYDNVYAFDADTNGGSAANPLWQISLLTNSTPAGTYVAQHGITGTPTIDLSSNTLYLVSEESMASNSAYLFRLHALDITTGAEKFGGPVQIQASVPGTGSGSSGGVLSFDAEFQRQRPGLLLLNGVVYAAFGSTNDNGTWHGWIFSYKASTLAQLDVFCTTPNGSGGGIWMGAAGLAAEVYNAAKPYGRMFVPTGNGSFTATPPYNSNTMSYSMSMLDLDLSGGQMTVEDEFTPFNWQLRTAEDGDFGSGGPVLLPTQTMASGKTLNPLLQVGKTGTIFLLDRDNNTDGSNNPALEYSPAGLGGFNASADQTVQEVQTPETTKGGWGAGVWGTEAYWNGNIYYGGTDPGESNSMTAYSIVNGVVSTAPTSQTAELFSYPGPTPSVSSNGTTNGIVWVLNHGTYTAGNAVLQAYDATNLANFLYSSNADLSRDNPGTYTEFSTPTVANGKVYVNAQGDFSVYGLLGVTPTAATPVISPPGGTFTNSQSVTITDATSGAAIYYTTNGTTPTVASTLYTGAFKVTASETVMAIASANGSLQSAAASAVFSSTANAANPVLSLAAGNYTGTQTLTITDSSKNATIYYTFDGTTPSTSSTVYTGPTSIPVTETIQAIATAPGLLVSSVVGASYTITPPYAIDFSQGFAGAQASGQMQFNGSTDLDDFRLQLTDGVANEAGSAFFTTPVNVQSFSTFFTFQLSNPIGDGITFTIQGNSPTALGLNSEGLGYSNIRKSIGIKFDLRNNAGQGSDSTGLYVNGANPTVPSIDLTNTGINLHSGDYMNVNITYDGTTLYLTITDAVTLASWSQAFTINIPSYVGGPTAYVGFTGSTGGTATASQKLTYWTYLPGPSPVPNYPAGFDKIGMTLNGSSALSGTGLQLTNGGASEVASAFYGTPVDIDSFSTDFYFTLKKGTTSVLADGITFVIQNAGLKAIGGTGAGLGYSTIPTSVAVKFDTYNNAGEGTDSGGVYINGAMPTEPSVNMTASGLNLLSGDLMHANISYNGTALTWFVQDLTAVTAQYHATGTTTINIPHTIGSNTAYIGFTAASGDGTAVQTILDWTFTIP